MNAFGRFRVQLDPWEVDYGSELAVDTADDDFEETVSFDVEPDAAWGPIKPVPIELPEVVFVDGVRRVEARIVVRDGEKIANGALGTFGVGSVVVDAEGAHWGPAIVDRVVACGAGLGLPNAIQTTGSAQYRPITTPGTGPNDPTLAIQNEMRRAEARIAQDFASRGRLVVADGPLTFDAPEHGRALGYIKSLHRLYLPPDRLNVLGSLPVAGRTPLFSVRTSQKIRRFSWFLRLALPGKGESELSGLVRLEVADGVGLDEARTLANLTTANLPKFASRPARDPRAPQNLIPVGALEAHLRRALGDRRLARRHIRSFIAGEANNV